MAGVAVDVPDIFRTPAGPPTDLREAARRANIIAGMRVCTTLRTRDGSTMPGAGGSGFALSTVATARVDDFLTPPPVERRLEANGAAATGEEDGLVPVEVM